MAKLTNFANKLKKDEIYYIRYEKGTDKVRVEDLEGNQVVRVPFSPKEWKKFLKRNHCNIERGDYKHYMCAACDDNREFHEEVENGIRFEISAGQEINGKTVDVIRILP